MSGYDPKDWKWQVVDMIIAFVDSVDPNGNEARELLMEDEGQVNLIWEAVHPMFPTNRFKPGDELTAIELGRLFGHWRSLWIAMTISQVLRERLEASHLATVGIRDKIDSILTNGMPEAMKGIETGLFHLLAATTDPAQLDSIRENDKAFEALALAVRELSYLQVTADRENFMMGYGQALTCSPMNDDGSPKMPNKLAQLLMFCRPFAIRAGLAACDFQEGIDYFAGARITGHYESFTKYLQRRKASLRGKGRPKKKPAMTPKPKQKKSDNL